MAEKARIIVVEDDPSILLGLRMNLEREGYEVGTAEDGARGLERLTQENWDLAILDVMLPKMNGYELLCALRSQRVRTPVLVLSAKSAEVDKVMGLDLGAEDYVTKPFSVGELLARVRVALRRNRSDQTSGWRFGEVQIDPETRVVHRNGELVDLTATEFNVLAALVRAGGRILTREQIYEAVWGSRHHGTQRTVDNFIAQLRSKLDDPADPHHLLTVRGVGYRLAP